MKDYASMSDFEINRRVSIAMGEKFDIPKKPKPSPYLEITETTVSLLNCDGTRIERAIVRDYCNNPADAWPIITENRISIIHLDENEWGCRGDVDKSACRAINSNALRCAMIVFLMMNGGE